MKTLNVCANCGSSLSEGTRAIGDPAPEIRLNVDVWRRAVQRGAVCLACRQTMAQKSSTITEPQATGAVSNLLNPLQDRRAPPSPKADVVGFLTRRKSKNEDVFIRMRVIGAVLLFCDFFMWGPAMGMSHDRLNLPLALGLGIAGVLLMLPAIAFYTGLSAHARGDWVVDGVIWDGDQHAWLLGAFDIKISSKAKSDDPLVKQVQKLSRPPDSQVTPIKHLEVVINFSAPWNAAYREAYSVQGQGQASYAKLPDFYILCNSSLHQFCEQPNRLFGDLFGEPEKPKCGTVFERMRRIGNVLTPVDSTIPRSVKLLVRSPESKSETSRIQDRATRFYVAGGVGLAVGAAMDNSKTSGRKTMMDGTVYLLKDIAKEFGWSLAVDGVPTRVTPG